MRISDWSAYVCSSDLSAPPAHQVKNRRKPLNGQPPAVRRPASQRPPPESLADKGSHGRPSSPPAPSGHWRNGRPPHAIPGKRSEEHTSELQSLMRISYAVFCLKKKKYI